MIDPKHFVDSLAREGMDYYAGVPDSLLKDFCAYVDDYGSTKKHIITANEGNAIGIAAGYHMATGKYPIVYLQNSGLGNIINPITSLADKEVYSIPILLIVGWRGEPNIKDEPQHIKQGRITLEQLELLEIPYKIVEQTSDAEELAIWAKEKLTENSAPVALIVRKGAFANYKSKCKGGMNSSLGREEALNVLLSLIDDACIVSTTGKTSREVFELRVQRGESHRDFLTVGSMGHTLSIALGVAMGKPNKKVVCLDGDGSTLMHLGAIPIVGSIAPDNLVHVILNNAAHESVGGQPTVAGALDFKSIAHASGYTAYAVVSSLEDITAAWQQLASQKGPAMLEVRIVNGSRDDLGRPTSTPIENKQAFMDWVAQ